MITVQSLRGVMIHKIISLTIGHTNRNKNQQCPLIRPLHKTDIPNIVSRYSFPWTTPEKTNTLWKIYYQEQKDKVRTVAVIEKDDEILGYGITYKGQSTVPGHSYPLDDDLILWLMKTLPKATV
jgi:hypothetical protein